MLDDYLKPNPGVKDLPQLGIDPQPPSPQSDAINIRPCGDNLIRNRFRAKIFDPRWVR